MQGVRHRHDSPEQTDVLALFLRSCFLALCTVTHELRRRWQLAVMARPYRLISCLLDRPRFSIETRL